MDSEFLEWWLDGSIKGSDNEHWQTYRNLLNPCIYKWDYILKLENIEEESKWLFSKLNITEISYPPGNSHPTIPCYTDFKFSSLTVFVILTKLYKMEILWEVVSKSILNDFKATKTQQTNSWFQRRFNQFRKIWWKKF